jgi:hypothetical protein
MLEIFGSENELSLFFFSWFQPVLVLTRVCSPSLHFCEFISEKLNLAFTNV